MDVECMKNRPILLADDFLCKSTGAITNIVVWGSWLNDVLPEPVLGQPAASNVSFTLSIHADIPKGQAADWSMPGEVLWWTNFVLGEFAVEIGAEGLQEGWYDPATPNYLFPGDTNCWRYTFPIDPARAFVQTGTVDNPVVYWLDVQAQPINMMGEARFGWKTTPPTNRWNDAACWAPEVEPYAGFWQFMQYPPGHQLYNPEITNGFDLAFSIESGPVGQEEYPNDFGDAPDSSQVPVYPTLLVNNGAWHVITPGLLLGIAIDGEPDGQPTSAADGDDNNGVDDEDGVQFISGLYAGLDASIRVTTAGAGLLNAWIDANGNGNWDDPGEQVISDLPLTTGVHDLAFKVPPGPPGSSPVNSYMRFRYSSKSGLTVRGGALDGEVEDYAVDIRNVEDELEMDFGDAPPIYPVLRVQDGARHVAAGGGYIMGTQRDTEPDGQPGPLADGDDMTGIPDDEDGVFFPTNSVGQAMLVQGSNMTVRVVTPGAPWLSAWIDFDGDGIWGGAGETIAAAVPLSAGTNTLGVTAPSGGVLGTTYARFRTSSVPGPLGVTGAAPDGEVEDYTVMILQPAPISPPDITITNLVLSGGTGTWVRWSCDAVLMTQPLACTNLMDGATNPAAWTPLSTPGLAQQYFDTGSGSYTTRFYRVVAPFVFP